MCCAAWKTWALLWSPSPSSFQRTRTSFDMAYPLPKMDLVAVPDFEAGAMENWGLLVFRETTLLASKQGSSIDTLREVTLTIAHEMSHMVSRLGE